MKHTVRYALCIFTVKLRCTLRFNTNTSITFYYPPLLSDARNFIPASVHLRVQVSESSWAREYVASEAPCCISGCITKVCRGVEAEQDQQVYRWRKAW